jgi:predicted dehydrogenase
MKDQKKIRLGLIGVGNWALFAHFRVLRLLPEYEIVAIYSQRKEAAMAAATEYGIPHVYAPTKAADAQRALVAGSPRGRPVILF